MDDSVEDQMSALARSMETVARTWVEYNDSTAPPYQDGSTAAADARTEVGMVRSGRTYLTDMSLSCNYSMFHASDQLLGVAACTASPNIGWAMYPPARTALVALARANHVLSGESEKERLRRHLNDELAANSSTIKLALTHNQDVRDHCEGIQKRIRDDGENAGFHWRPNKGLPYFAADSHHPAKEAKPSETARVILLVSSMSSGVDDQLNAFSYRLLSEVVHDRPQHTGLSAHEAMGESRNGIQVVHPTTSAKQVARGTLLVARAYWMTGVKLLTHCGQDPSAFAAEVSEAIKPWDSFAEID
ncbi:hypothetical protein [Rhodococcus sp. NPDC055024]